MSGIITDLFTHAEVVSIPLVAVGLILLAAFLAGVWYLYKHTRSVLNVSLLSCSYYIIKHC